MKNLCNRKSLKAIASMLIVIATFILLISCAEVPTSPSNQSDDIPFDTEISYSKTVYYNEDYSQFELTTGFEETQKTKSYYQSKVFYNKNDQPVYEEIYPLGFKNILCTAEYNAQGLIVKYNYSDKSFSFEYNSENNITKESAYDATGALTSYYVYEYDDNQNLTKTATYDKDNIEVYASLSEYNQFNDITKSSTYSNGELKSCTLYEYEYDSNQNITKSSIYSNGELKSCTLYEYDSNQNVTKTSSYNQSNELEGYIISEYDTNGNNTKESYYNAHNELTKYMIYEYDANGNNTKVSYYDAHNELTRYVIYEYVGETMVKYASYRGDDTLLVLQEWNENGDQTRHITYDYPIRDDEHQYDSEYNLIKRSHLIGYPEPERISAEYKYDERYKLIELHYYDQSNEFLVGMKRTYDENDICIHSVIYSPDGNIIEENSGILELIFQSINAKIYFHVVGYNQAWDDSFTSKYDLTTYKITGYVETYVNEDGLATIRKELRYNENGEIIYSKEESDSE